MIGIQEIIRALDMRGAKEVILVAGARPAVKLKQGIEFFNSARMKPDDVKNLLVNLKQRSNLVNKPLGTKGNFSVGIPGVGRLQVFYSVQRGSYMVAVKKVNDMPPFLREILANPRDRDRILSIFREPVGFLIIQSPSETMIYNFVAAVLTNISKYNKYVIHTIEDPITYILKHDQSLVLQTEVGQDIESIKEGLKVAEYINPDVLYISRLSSPEELSELLPIIERGNMVILPVISASLEAAFVSLERISEDPSLLRNTLSLFLRACFHLAESDMDKIEVKITEITPECRESLKRGDYTKLFNG